MHKRQSQFRKHRNKQRTKTKRRKVPVLASVKAGVKALALLPIAHKKKQRSGKEFLKKDISKRAFLREGRPDKRSSMQQFADQFYQKKGLIAPISLAVSLSALFFVLFIQDTFYLQRVYIVGAQEVDPNAVTEVVQNHFDSRSLALVKHGHLFFVDEQALEEEIRSKYGIESIEFVPHWVSHAMTVKLTEKQSVIAYNQDDIYYTVDRQGVLVRQLETLDELDVDLDIPVIYRDRSIEGIEPGREIIEASAINTIIELQNELNKYPFFKVHSFRLVPLEQREISYFEPTPELTSSDDDEDAQTENETDSDQVNQLIESIAQAGTREEQIALLQQSLEELDIEKLEEERIQEILREQRVFKPSEGFQLEELEVLSEQGWTLRLGHQVLSNPELVETYLNIFATLAGEVNVEEEVGEYVDLRFPGRIYYR